MSGVKGRSGGARLGAGRKQKQNSISHNANPVRIDRESEEAFVYVIYEAEDPGVSKIGVASDLVKRLSSMQVGTWRILKIAHAVKLQSKSAAHAIERQVHQSLSALHVRGEWFRVSHDRAALEVDIALSQLKAAFCAVARLQEATHG